MIIFKDSGGSKELEDLQNAPKGIFENIFEIK